MTGKDQTILRDSQTPVSLSLLKSFLKALGRRGSNGQQTPEVHLQEAPLTFAENSWVALKSRKLSQPLSTQQKEVLLEDRPGAGWGARSVHEQPSNTPLDAAFAKRHLARKGTQSKTKAP